MVINIRIYIKKLIEEQDVPCQVMEFSSGEELLRFWGQEDREQLDILFLDISMDGTDGMETAEQIRNFTQIFHKSSFRFYIDQIPFDYRKILGRIIVEWISLDC